MAGLRPMDAINTKDIFDARLLKEETFLFFLQERIFCHNFLLGLEDPFWPDAIIPGLVGLMCNQALGLQIPG